MNTPGIFLLRSLSIVDVRGKDAGQILHNLTTNDVQSLDPQQSLETFITEVRGKVLHHVVAIRTSDGFRLIGPSGHETSSGEGGEPLAYSQRLVNHCDRYTIREEAEPVIRDDDFAVLVVAPEVNLDSVDLPFAALTWHDTRWLGMGTKIALIELSETASLSSSPDELFQDETAFHNRRVHAGFPWYGIDFNEKHLPQEADRDEVAINFNKGCYLGQETVARLDALGQVQKKIVRWKVSTKASAGDALTAGDKTVGRLTSLAQSRHTDSNVAVLALGMARRSHFDAGTSAIGNPGEANEYQAEVVPSDD